MSEVEIGPGRVADPGGEAPRLALAPLPGGALLRALRRQAGRTQLWVEAEAGLGSGYLQRLEAGRVLQPERVTLERTLNALGARYSERREILGRFGYTISTPRPTAEETAWARDACRRELDEAAFPAYALDCSPRLIAWNRLVPPLFGVAPDDPRLAQLTDQSFLGAWFAPNSLLGPLVAEPERFLPALLRALRYEVEPFYAEPWLAEELARLWRTLPLFRRYWMDVAREPAPVSADRPLVPLRLVVPGAGTLTFRLASERFTRDARFRLIYYLPADPETMRWCAEQAERSTAAESGVRDAVLDDATAGSP
ncbi:MAG TPA: helix-turn-helix domain-containing protein [Dehalococcoidia bacterium]|nr:helix-turn-helix domain-containing protein [Dehalococcoidia bacterium]